jgi:hypothetical protein
VPRYATLAQVQAAYASGEIPAPFALVLDNDASYVYVGDEEVYQGGGPAELIEEALDLLGIPHEPC